MFIHGSKRPFYNLEDFGDRSLGYHKRVPAQSCLPVRWQFSDRVHGS